MVIRGYRFDNNNVLLNSTDNEQLRKIYLTRLLVLITVYGLEL